jgi:hypothetical protein
MRQYVHAMRASPGGRLVVYNGQPLADEPPFDRSASFVTAVHDLRQSLSWIDRPLRTVTEGERRSWWGCSTAGASRPGQLTLAPDERQVLGLIRSAAENRLRRR